MLLMLVVPVAMMPMMLVNVRMFAHQDRNVRVVHHVVTDAAHERAPQGAHSTTAQHDERHVFFLGDFDDGLPWLASDALHNASEPMLLQLFPKLVDNVFDPFGLVPH